MRTKLSASSMQLLLLLGALLVSSLLPLVTVTEASTVPTTGGTPFRHRTYAQIVAALRELNATYPELVQVFVAQEKYNLPYPTNLTCVEDDETREEVPCKQFVVHLTNHTTLPDVSRPEVFISGALHGNERVGPITTVELITLIAKLATAYADPSKDDEELSASNNNTKRWLHELVNTRSIFITPMTNAYGYAHDERGELNVDPNRDFSYLREPEQCMTTMVARVVNELWRDHVFQLAITFHAFLRSISYEWGSPDHFLHGNPPRSEKSPDHTAQFQLANTFATFAGAFADGALYPTGPMNDIVYGVSGGMEDWAYAASWENQFVSDEKQKPFHPCRPQTFGGYDPMKTIYNNVTHRAFNMLVETSFIGEPEEKDLGLVEDLYMAELDFFHEQSGFQTGHVTRNVRLALLMLEMVQPYIRWIDTSVSVSSSSSNDISAFPPVELYIQDFDQNLEMGCHASSTRALPAVQVASCGSTSCLIQRVKGTSLQLQLTWEVLGALTVDSTFLEVSTSPSFESEDIFFRSTDQKGTTRRLFNVLAQQTTSNSPNSTRTPLFLSCLAVEETYPTKFYIRAIATVDQDWAQQGSGDDVPSPHVPPQSHMVNARTNPNWDMNWNGHRVHASRVWYSPVLTVTLAEEDEDVPVAVNTASSHGNVPLNGSWWFGAGALGVVIAFVALQFVYRRIQRNAYTPIR